MTDTMKALDEIEAALKDADKTIANASRQLTEEHRMVLGGATWGGSAIEKVSASLALLPTLRVALAPAGDDEVGAIRERHEACDRSGVYKQSPSEQAAHNDRATLLRLLSEERARRVEVEETLNTVGAVIVQDAYDAGFMDSGEGWNGEYPGDAPTTEYYADTRIKSIAGVWGKHARATHKDTQDE